MTARTMWTRFSKHIQPRVFHHILFRRDLAEPIPDLPNPAGAEVELSDYLDLDGLLAELGDQTCRRLIQDGLRHGWRCYLARVGGRVAGVTFSGQGPVKTRRQVILELAPDERYNEGSYVIPNYRRRKVFRQLMVGFYRAEAKAGVRRIYALVDPENLPSVRTHENLGAVPILKVSVLAWMLMNFRLPGPRRGP